VVNEPQEGITSGVSSLTRPGGRGRGYPLRGKRGSGLDRRQGTAYIEVSSEQLLQRLTSGPPAPSQPGPSRGEAK